MPRVEALGHPTPWNSTGSCTITIVLRCGCDDQHSALRRGAIEFIETEGEAKFLAFRRSDDSETLLVGLNRDDAEYRWQLPLADGESITQIFTASGNIQDFSLDRYDAGMTVAIPPCDGVVLELHRNE